MKRTFAYGASAQQGGWPVQEDGFFVDPGAGIFAIADGFGGRGAGDLAAKMALQRFRAPAEPVQPREGGIISPTQAWHRELFSELNLQLLQWNEKRGAAPRGGCSVLLANVIQERELVLTGCGACSAFLVRAGKWTPLLLPQSAPRSAPGEPLFPAQALGLGRELNPESRSLSWQAGDLLFLFSSGLEWDRDSFQADTSGQLALRLPGDSLAAVAEQATRGNDGLSPWNQTAVVVEALP